MFACLASVCLSKDGKNRDLSIILLYTQDLPVFYTNKHYYSILCNPLFTGQFAGRPPLPTTATAQADTTLDFL